MNNLRSKTIKGGLFLSVTNMVTQVFAIVLNVILARLLLVEDFGVIALASTYMGFITLFTNIGFGSAVIHNNEATNSQISTLYWLNFILGVFSFLVVMLSAPFASKYYSEPALTNVVMLSSLSLIIFPFFITHQKLLERDLRYDLIAKIMVIATFLSALVAIGMAYLDFGVFALVGQILGMSIFKLIFTLYYSNWKPKFVFKLREVKGMVWYALKYKTAQGALYLERNIDYLILGKIFSSTILGYYSFSYNIMYTPVKRISNIFNDILFPSLSKLKHDSAKIIKAYFQSKQLIAMVAFPVMTVLAFNAEIIIDFVFGDKWLKAIPILKILCFAGAFQSISQFGSAIFNSIGKPEKSLYIAVFRTIITVGAILLGSFYGILTVAYFLLLTKIISWIVVLIAIRMEIHFNVIAIWSYLKGTIVCMVLLFLSEYLFEYYGYFEISSLIKLILQILLATVVILVFYRKILMDLFKVIVSKIS